MQQVIKKLIKQFGPDTTLQEVLNHLQYAPLNLTKLKSKKIGDLVLVKVQYPGEETIISEEKIIAITKSSLTTDGYADKIFFKDLSKKSIFWDTEHGGSIEFLTVSPK